jgi:hypothetical protein
MNAQLNYIAAQQHTAELHRAAARARAASKVQTNPPSPRTPGPIARLGARLAPGRA